jgi:lipopolysaccharide transport system permease protein
MPLTFIRRLWSHRELIARLTQREILLRYRGSLLGWGWTLLNPLMMLAIYTFVFSAIFKARWESTGLEWGRPWASALRRTQRRSTLPHSEWVGWG